MNKETARLIKQLLQLFHENADAQKATQMKAYMKNHFVFFGIPKPMRAELSKAFIKDILKLETNEIASVCNKLWIMLQRELQYVALDLLLKSKIYREEDSIRFFEWLIVTQSWWDTVDAIASHPVGRYLLEFPGKRNQLVESFCNSGNIWLIRTTILFQLNYKDKTDETLLFELCKMYSGEKEYFIKKAIGWALRQYARTKPETVRLFVKSHPLQPLSIREALKHL